MNKSFTVLLLTSTFSIALLSQPATLDAKEFKKSPAKLYDLREGLPNFFAKLNAGKEVRIAYLGGSITAANGWRPKTLKWFQEKYPNAKVSEINAAISGTGSELGVFRLDQDVLQHKPDLLFVEFAVNDSVSPPEQVHRSIEGIVRKTWKHDPTIDICFVYTIGDWTVKEYQNGLFPGTPTAMEHVAAHYGIPSIGMGLRVAELEKAGKLVFTGKPDDGAKSGKIVFARDGCHPRDAGHEIYREVIAEAMDKMAPADASPLGTIGPHKLKIPFRKDNWENAKMVPISQAMLSGSWRKMKSDEGLSKRFRGRLPQIWHGSTPGDKLTFTFSGTMARLYDIIGPDGGQLRITVDGKPISKPSPRFDSYCTYHRLTSVTLCKDLEPKEHTVTLEILPEQPDREPVLKQVRDKPDFKTDRYNGTNVWIGYLLILGDD